VPPAFGSLIFERVARHDRTQSAHTRLNSVWAGPELNDGPV